MCSGPRCIADTRCVIGENPLWHAEEQALYWCDIPAGQLFRFDWERGDTRLVRDPSDGRALGGFTLEADGSLLLFLEGGRINRWQQGTETMVHPGTDRERASRFNDVIAAADGQVFCGTMSTDLQAGRLYQLRAGQEPAVIMEDVGCPNGMAFHANGALLYFTDSFEHTVYQLDYDVATGNATDPRVCFTTPENQGFPDGLTLDAEGCFWQARWGAGFAARLSATGQELQRVYLPADKVSSVTIGGPDLRTLFLTTAGGNDRPAGGKLAGAVFAFELQAGGRAEYRSRIALNQPASKELL